MHQSSHRQNERRAGPSKQARAKIFYQRASRSSPIAGATDATRREPTRRDKFSNRDRSRAVVDSYFRENCSLSLSLSFSRSLSFSDYTHDRAVLSFFTCRGESNFEEGNQRGEVNNTLESWNSRWMIAGPNKSLFR